MPEGKPIVKDIAAAVKEAVAAHKTLMKEEAGPPRVMTQDEFFGMSQQLENRNSLFYKFWEMGRPIFTRQIETAAVGCDKETGRYISFMFNPDFWDYLDPYSRVFVIAHEMVHIILNHGLRGRDCQNKVAANVCMDLVGNRLLTEKFKFSRKKVKGADDAVWKDTLFDNNPFYSGPPVEHDKSFEHYYNLMMEHFPKSPQGGKGKDKGKGKGQGSGGSSQPNKDGEPQGGSTEGPTEEQVPSTLDDHEGLTDEQFEELLEELNDTLSDDEKNELKDMLDEHFQDESNAPEGEGDKEGEGDGGNPGGKEAGTKPGFRWTFAKVDASKVRAKRKWETVIQKWMRKSLRLRFKDTEQWARMNRRFSSMGMGGSLMLPTEMEVEDVFWDEDRIQVWFFQDTSGSCHGFRDRFFKAAASLPKDKFDIRMFCFDTQVYETTLESGKLYGFGGTEFPPIEAKIQSVIAAENTKYPAAVFVVTDGYGTKVSPQHPERWFWFLSEKNLSCIPDKSPTFLLKDYE